MEPRAQRGRKSRGALGAQSFFASGVQNGFKMKGAQLCSLGQEGLRGSRRQRRQPDRGTSGCRVWPELPALWGRGAAANLLGCGLAAGSSSRNLRRARECQHCRRDP